MSKNWEEHRDSTREVTVIESGQPLHHHRRSDCMGSCCLHGTSTAQVCKLPRQWRSDRKILEHVCAHGVGHPCPSGWLRGGDGTHGCDGCCAPGYTPPLVVLDDEVGRHALLIADLQEAVADLGTEFTWREKVKVVVKAAAVLVFVVTLAAAIAIVLN